MVNTPPQHSEYSEEDLSQENRQELHDTLDQRNQLTPDEKMVLEKLNNEGTTLYENVAIHMRKNEAVRAFVAKKTVKKLEKNGILKVENNIVTITFIMMNLSLL